MRRESRLPSQNIQVDQVLGRLTIHEIKKQPIHLRSFDVSCSYGFWRSGP